MDNSCLTSKYFLSELKQFVNDHQKLHDHIENQEFDLIQTELLNIPGNLCHLYDINNTSLMNHAMQNYQKELYDILSSHGISLGSHEDPDVVFEEFKKDQKLEKEAIKIKFANQSNALELSNTHIDKIMSKFKVINNSGNQHRHRTKVIRDALVHMNRDKTCSKILKFVASCKNLKIFADFKHKAVNFIDPVCCKRTLGLTTATGVIRIGAKDLLNESTKNEFNGTMIHEFCHLAMLMTFLNNFNPYSVGDKDAKELFEDAVEECRLNKDQEPIILGAFEYDQEEQHSELVVGVVTMIMKYYNEYLSDGTSKIENCRRIFSKLFKYFDDKVVPALDEVLNIFIILQGGEQEVSYKDLTQHQKNRIKHKTNIFQGTGTTFFDVLGKDEKIYEHLTGKEIRYFLFTEKTYIFNAAAINGEPSDLERSFYLDNGLCNGSSGGFTLVKDELERQGTFLLIDNAGAGKTEAFIDLSKRMKKEHKNFLICLVDMCLQHVTDIFTKWMDKVNRQQEKLDEKAILNLMLEVLKLKSKFEKEIFQILFTKMKIIFFFDGIDKLNADLLDFFIKFVQVLKSKPPQIEESSIFKIKILISSCPTTLIESKKLCPTICDKSYKLANYSPEERISYIFDTFSIPNQGERLEKMVWYIWFFNQVEYDQEHELANISIIKTIIQQHNDPKINSHFNQYNIFSILNHLYQLKNVNIMYNPKRNFTLLKILQAYALSSIFGNDIEFLLTTSWNREKRLWKSHEFESYGLVYSNTEDVQNVSKFIDKTCPDYFVTAYLIKLLFGEDDSLKEEEFKNAVKSLRVIGKSPNKYQIIYKSLLQYIKADLELSFCKEAKDSLIVEIENIRNDITSSDELVDSLSFWSMLLSKDQSLLKDLWQHKAYNNLLKTVILKNENSIDFIKILKIVSTSFGANLFKSFLIDNQINLNSQNQSNGIIITKDCEEFNINLQFFMKFMSLKLDDEQIRIIYDKVLTSETVVKHINLLNIQTCLNKCREIFKNDEEFFTLVFKRFIHNTTQSTILQYFGNNFELLLQNNQKSIKDLLFSTSCARPLILISMSYCSSIFNVFKNLFIKYDSNSQFYNYLNKNIIKVFLSMTKSNFKDVTEFLIDIYCTKFCNLIDAIENVDDELKNNLIFSSQKLKYFAIFLKDISLKNQAYPYICKNLYCEQRFDIKDCNLSFDSEHLESVKMLYVVYIDLMDKLLNYFDHKCEFSHDFKFELYGYPENFKTWFENNETFKKSKNFGLFLKFFSRVYLRNKKEFDKIVFKAFKIDEKNLKLILDDFNKCNLNENNEIARICEIINNNLLQ